MDQNDVIRTVGLTRYFGRRAVVRDLDLRVPRGAVVGLLGLNGAGKTTTIRMLLGLLSPTRGRAQVLGCDSRRLTPDVRARVGHTVEGHFLYGWMTIAEVERFGRGTFPRWNSESYYETVSRFRISSGTRVRQLSRGQRAGTSLASMLAAQPELLVLDDPALGLDPLSRRALNESIVGFCESGERSVLLSTHLLDDVERIADRIAVMVGGRLLVDVRSDELRDRVGVWMVDSEQDPSRSVQLPRLIDSRPLGGRWALSVADPDDQTECLIRDYGARYERFESSFEDTILAYLSRSETIESVI